MNKIRSYEDVRSNLKYWIDTYNNERDAWKNVKHLTKKDGSNFTVLSKNFDNASIEAKYGELKLVVSYSDANGRYEESEIDIKCLVENAGKEIEEDRIVKVTYLKPYFERNVDELFQAIEEKIKWLDNEIEDIKNQLAISEVMFVKVNDIMKNLENVLKEIPRDGVFKNSLQYRLEDYVHAYYFR